MSRYYSYEEVRGLKRYLEEDIEAMDVFDPAYFDTSDYKTYDLPKEYDYFASCIASITEAGLKYKLFEV